MNIYIIGFLIFPFIIYYVVRSATHEGIYNALREYDKQKKDGNNNNKA